MVSEVMTVLPNRTTVQILYHIETRDQQSSSYMNPPVTFECYPHNSCKNINFCNTRRILAYIRNPPKSVEQSVNFLYLDHLPIKWQK